jgi:hypothetical protein
MKVSLKKRRNASYAKMWPRELFNCKNGKEWLVGELKVLSQPGVYVLYRDQIPYYVGKAAILRDRLWAHANKHGGKHYLFWNYFSVFVVRNATERSRLESYLIAAMPTANGAKLRIRKAPLPLYVRRYLHNHTHKILQLKSAIE